MNASSAENASLNAEQLAAASYTGRNLLVIAGAGSGKTRTIIARAKYLIEHGADESRIRLLSFTRKAAEEIVSRIVSEVGELSQGLLKGQTFHSWCFEIIKSNPQYFAQSDWTLLVPEEVEQCIGYVRGLCVPDDAHCPTNHDIAAILSRMLNTRCKLTRAMRFVLLDCDDDGTEESNADPIFLEKKHYVQCVIERFNEYKTDHRYIDYDDMLEIVAQTMSGDEAARDEISAQFDHILVDEMQDTNRLQYDVLANFTEKSHLFCVGDDAQSIYAFRGADFNSIHHFTEVIPNSEIYRLETNYRSTQAVLDLSNWLLTTSSLDYHKHMHAVRGQGVKPTVVNWTSSVDQATDIAMRIQRAVNQGEHYSDHMVLARRGFELDEVRRACISRKIPVQVFGGMELMKCAHILDLLTSFRIVANYLDELAWVRFLKCFRGLGDATTSMIVKFLSQCGSFEDALRTLKERCPRPEPVQTLLAVHENAERPAEAVSAALGFMEAGLSARYSSNWQYRRQDFASLRELATEAPSVELFVAQYMQENPLWTVEMNELETPTDVVTLSTVHSAKGLEASNVYVINVSQGKCPDAKSFSRDAIEEERRCLYVAMTRAKDTLILYRKLFSAARGHGLLDDPTSNDRYFLTTMPGALVTEETIHKNGFVASSGASSAPCLRKPIKPRLNFD